jgi:hypothetical protein
MHKLSLQQRKFLIKLNNLQDTNRDKKLGTYFNHGYRNFVDDILIADEYSDNAKVILLDIRTKYIEYAAPPQITTYVCLTGSPKQYGYSTKASFLSNFTNVVEVKLTDNRCNYLITNTKQSRTLKMQKAVDRGIPIIAYNELKTKIL